ncbi:MAG: HIT family protein [Myxococcota bacterium]
MSESCSMCAALEKERPLWQNDLWAVRHIEAPWGLAGWMQMVAKRHVTALAAMNDAESASFGPTLRWLEKTLLEVSGAERIYTAALGEAVPHLHVHMVPRYVTMPKGAKGWPVFDLQRAGKVGEIVVPSDRVEKISRAFAAALSQPPRRR